MTVNLRVPIKIFIRTKYLYTQLFTNLIKIKKTRRETMENNKENIQIKNKEDTTQCNPKKRKMTMQTNSKKQRINKNIKICTTGLEVEENDDFIIIRDRNYEKERFYFKSDGYLYTKNYFDCGII
jgi:hypothetical protein